MIRALAIDGGGVRGILPATVLAALEELTGRRAHELFDLVAGTSAGAMLALGLTRPEPRPALELRGLFLDRGAVIFPPATEPGEPLDPAPLEAELADRLETTAMSEALRPAVAVSCDAAARRPVLFRGGGLDPGPVGDVPMVRAALASSAFPGVFPAVRHVGADGVARSCVDGGLIAADPGLVAYAEALALGGGEEVLLVSLGTGLGPPPEATERRRRGRAGGRRGPRAGARRAAAGPRRALRAPADAARLRRRPRLRRREPGQPGGAAAHRRGPRRARAAAARAARAPPDRLTGADFPAPSGRPAPGRGRERAASRL